MNKISQNKICSTCNKEFSKPYNRSIKSWSVARFCSRGCKRLTEETKNVLRDINTGRLFRPYSSEERNCLICNKLFRVWKAKLKVGKGKFCSRDCYNIDQKTTSYLLTDRNPSKTPEGLARLKLQNKGDKSPNWQGGITPLRIKIHRSKEYVDWRTKCFIRDSYTCIHCGQVGGKLDVDHIKSFSLIKFENNILTLEDAINCQELWNISNGRTLCKPCHNKTDNYGWKSYYQTFGVHPALGKKYASRGRFGL
jgi:hypothetical protein